MDIKNRSHYSEAEAAATLGMTIVELRGMVQAQTGCDDEEMSSLAKARFLPSDLVLLRFLRDGHQPPTGS